MDDRDAAADKNDQGSNRQKDGHMPGHASANITRGWQPNCKCGEHHTDSGVALDPFMGSGTTAKVAIKFARHFIGYEINPVYIPLSDKRTDKVQLQMV